MSLDHRDNILQSLCPTVMVPKFSPLDPLHGPGHRFLAAADGLWLEVQRPWLRLVWPLCGQTEVKMPYGEVRKTIEFSFDRVPENLLHRLIIDAQNDHPLESEAWLVWNEEAGSLEYRNSPDWARLSLSNASPI
jgi:PRTRC genetic system protein A